MTITPKLEHRSLTFSKMAVLVLSLASAHAAFATGPDFDCDRYADIADQFDNNMAFPGDQPFWVRTNLRNGSFTPPGPSFWAQGIATGPRSQWHTLVGDFTGDGCADYADLHIPSGSVWVHQNIGSAFRGSGLHWSFSIVGTGRETVAGDLNHDGLDDIVVVGWNGGLVLYRNVGTGGFQNMGSPTFSLQGNSPDWNTGIGDFDGDGYADLVDINIPNALFWVHLNLGNWNFDNAVYGNNPVQGIISEYSRIIFADFTGDGYTDFADVNLLNGSFAVHENLRNGTFNPLTWGSGLYTQGQRWGVMGTYVTFP